MDKTRILLWAPTQARSRQLQRELRHAARARIGDLRLVSTWNMKDVSGRLKQSYFNLLLLDLRGSPGQRPAEEEVLQLALQLLESLDAKTDLDLRFGFHRILVLVADHAPDRVDRFLLEIGPLGVGGVLRQRGGSSAKEGFAERVLTEAYRLISSRTQGPRALCLSGGGITGIHFELGALKCLDDCLSDNAVNTFDLVYGISAGAVVAGLITAGFSIDECMAAVAGYEGGRLPPLDLGLLKLKHLNTEELRRRFRRGSGAIWSATKHVWGRTARESLDSLAFSLSDLLGPPFQSAAYETMLREILTLPGVTNDFRKLPRKLFIGASDLDARSHVLFGDADHDRVPISKAIQASLSIHPIFGATRIGKRCFGDGVITRTSNFAEAIRHGAKLVLVLDPFVPYTSRKPGFASRRGLFYNIDQDLRTASYTRFETTRNWVLRSHPEVSSYTFVPGNRIRGMIAVNAMDDRRFLEIWKGSYLSTLNRLEVIQHRFRGDLAAYGLTLQLDTARAVARQLQKSRATDFADFFPGRRVDLRQPPLSCAKTPTTHVESARRDGVMESPRLAGTAGGGQ